jgi:2-succinyl-6-hydroxy-2,4-cyclohexadiene-1-carboxylate synthase
VSSEALVLLHGFGGTHRAWDGLIARLGDERYRPLALDLPGHGREADAARPITFDGCVAHVLHEAPERFVLLGYSMGARVALHVALVAPERLSRLILVAGNPGIEDPAERAARGENDERLAVRLETEPFADWIESWRSQPLFQEEPPDVRAQASADQLRNDPRALAAVLRGLSTGKMTPLWDRLSELRMHVDVVVGERDRKFAAIGERMEGLLPDGSLCVLSGGHGLPIENPDALAGLLERAPTS